jgi:hypothetical protein
MQGGLLVSGHGNSPFFSVTENCLGLIGDDAAYQCAVHPHSLYFLPISNVGSNRTMANFGLRRFVRF